MHGFAGWVGHGLEESAPVRRWMMEWIELEPRKTAFEVRNDALHYVASTEPGRDLAPVAEDDQGRRAFFAGILALDHLEGAPGQGPKGPTEAAAALLQLLRDGGPDSLVGLNGRYVAFVWDHARNVLHIMNDTLGLMPVFLWQHGHGLSFASNLWAIASHPAFKRELDPRSVADVLMFGLQQGERTLFDEVTLLAPGSRATFEDGRLTIHRVRDLPFSDGRFQWSIERAAAEMYSVLSASVRRRALEGEPVVLPLTGGFDSRTLLGLLSEARIPVRAITQSQGRLYGEDGQYARRLARRAGAEHSTAPLGEDFLDRYRQKSVAISGGLYDIHTGRMLSLLDGAADRTSTLVCGFLGGGLTSRFLKSDADFSSPEEHCRLCFAGAYKYRFGVEEASRMLGPRMPAGLAQDVLEENERFFMSHDGPPHHQFFHWDLLIGRRRYVSYLLHFFGQFRRVVAPFTDREFVAFMLSLPFAAIRRQQVYRDMLCTCLPHLAKIPNTNDMPVLPSTSEVLRTFIGTQWRRFAVQPVQRVFPSRRNTGQQQEIYGVYLSGASRGVLDHILDCRDLLAPYLVPGEVERFVGMQRDGNNSFSMGILGLSALATGLQMAEDPGLALRAWAKVPMT